MVNVQTRLVDAFVTVPSPHVFVLGQYVAGRITVRAVRGIIVPKSAVLPEQGKANVFVVRDTRAIKTTVRVLAESTTESCVTGAGLEPNDQVATIGNYELKDGMRVLVEP